MSIGLVIARNTLATSQTVTASVTLVGATGLSVPVKSGKRYHFRIAAGFTVGASGGFKFRLDGPANPTSYLNAQQVNDGVTASPGAQICAVVTALADFANAFASVAGNHQLTMEGDFVAAADGALSLQFACNSAAGAIVLLQGSYLEVTAL